jgi:hypothetical protein
MICFVQPVNITLISLSFEDELRDGFLQASPVYDVLIRHIKQSNPVVFANFSHIALRYANQKIGTADVQQVGQTSWSNKRDHAADFFFSFFFKNQYLFTGNLSVQFTIITTPGKIIFYEYFSLNNYKNSVA